MFGGSSCSPEWRQRRRSMLRRVKAYRQRELISSADALRISSPMELVISSSTIAVSPAIVSLPQPLHMSTAQAPQGILNSHEEDPTPQSRGCDPAVPRTRREHLAVAQQAAQRQPAVHVPKGASTSPLSCLAALFSKPLAQVSAFFCWSSCLKEFVLDDKFHSALSEHFHSMPA